MQDKEVWYLDQSFISNLAKAHDQLLPAGDPHYEIYEEMRRAVREDTIICPESEYHYLEALLDSRLLKPIRKASRWLSWGVSFKEHQEVIIAQALVALREHLGKPTWGHDDWRIALSQDPQLPVASLPSRTVKGELRPCFTGGWPRDEERAAELRASKDAVVRTVEAVAAKQGRPRSFEDAVREEKAAFVQEYFVVPGQLSPTCLTSVTGTRTLGQLEHALNVAQRCEPFETISNEMANHLINDPAEWARYDEHTWSFVLSGKLMDIPYIDIFATLVAATAYYSPSRPTGRGDPFDFGAVAVVLPYVDVIVTDSYVADLLVSRTHLAEYYHVRVAPGTRAGLAEISSLVAPASHCRT